MKTSHWLRNHNWLRKVYTILRRNECVNSKCSSLASFPKSREHLTSTVAFPDSFVVFFGFRKHFKPKAFWARKASRPSKTRYRPKPFANSPAGWCTGKLILFSEFPLIFLDTNQLLRHKFIYPSYFSSISLFPVTRKSEAIVHLVKENSALQGHVMLSFQARDELFCALKCLNTVNCFSFNYKTYGNICELSHANKFTSPMDLKRDLDSDYYEMKFF